MTRSQSLNHYITYSIITSQPALSFTSSVSTIRCFEVTSGPHAGGTFVQWSGNFSSDADAGECGLIIRTNDWHKRMGRLTWARCH